MPTSTMQVSCSVRPIRLAFALPKADAATLRGVFAINTQLWGGVFNPVFILNDDGRVVVGEQEQFGRPYLTEVFEMLRAFDPDFIVNFADRELPSPLDIFNHRLLGPDQLKWNPWGKGEVSFYLESWPFIEALWREEFRFAQNQQQTFRYLNPAAAEDSLFATARFGVYATESHGNERVKAWFRAEPFQYDETFRKQFVPGELAFPISLS